MSVHRATSSVAYSEKERLALFFGEPRQASPLCRPAASDATALPKASDSAGFLRNPCAACDAICSNNPVVLPYKQA